MSNADRERTGFEATLAELQITANDSFAFDETVAPADVASWTSFHGSGRLPTISARCHQKTRR